MNIKGEVYQKPTLKEKENSNNAEERALYLQGLKIGYQVPT